ncbi:MAG: hypothetical protein D6785_06880, partial [Planctomycetota bacterium]
GGVLKLYKLEFPDKPILPITDYDIAKSFPAESADSLWSWIVEKAVILQEFMKPYPGAARFLSDLKKRGHTNILITSQPAVKLKQSAMIWLAAHPDILRSLDTIVIGDFRKTAKTCLPVDVLLDDCITNLKLAKQTLHVLPVLMKRNWNSDWDGLKITEYAELFCVLDKNT